MIEVACSVVEKEQYDYLASVTDSKLIFSYEMLEKATKYFHDSNKLGEGGSGHIYKVDCPILDISFPEYYPRKQNIGRG